MSDETPIFETREHRADAPSINVSLRMYFGLCKRLVVVLREELYNPVGLRPFLKIKDLFRFVVQSVDVDRNA